MKLLEQRSVSAVYRYCTKQLVVGIGIMGCLNAARADVDSVYGEKIERSALPDIKYHDPGVKYHVPQGFGQAPSSAVDANASAFVRILATLGPRGMVYNPFTGEIKKDDNNKFWSLYFTISSSPILKPDVRPGNKTISRVYHQGQDLRKLDTVMEIIPLGDEIPDPGKSDPVEFPNPLALSSDGLQSRIKYLQKKYFPVKLVNHDSGPKPQLKWARTRKVLNAENGTDNVEVLAMYPNSTQASTEISDAAAAALVAQQTGAILAGTLTSTATGGLTSSSFGPKLQSTAGGLSVVFDKLFPPKSVPTQYAFQKTPNEFGWYFRQFTRSEKAISLLGVKTGAITFRTAKDVKAILVRSSALSTWKEAVSGDSPHSSAEFEQIIKLPEEEKSLDEGILEVLGDYKILVPREVVKKLLFSSEMLVGDDDPLDSLIRDFTNKDDKRILVQVGPKGAITKNSLLEFLGLKEPAKQSDGGGGGAGAGAGNKLQIFLDKGQGSMMTP